MKVDKIKLIIAFAICALLGFLCYITIPEFVERKWIYLATATISMFVCFAPALAIKFETVGNRSVSGKVVGWIFFIILIIDNFIFCLNEYKITTYFVITALITIIGVGVIYSISKS